MRRIRALRPSPATVVACLALLVALGGTGIAAVNALPPNSVGTAQLMNNAVNSAKVLNGSLLAADFKAGQIPPRQSVLWAVIAPNGAIHRSSGTVSAAKGTTGTYRVVFDRNVSTCAYVATVGNPAGTGAWFGIPSVAVDPAVPAVVEVDIFDASMRYSDKPFYLAVIC